MANVEEILKDDIFRTEELFTGLKIFHDRIIGLSDTEESSRDIEFEEYARNTLTELNLKIGQLNKQPIMSHVEVVMSRHRLLDICFQQLAIVCNALSPSLCILLQGARDIQEDIVSEMYETTLDVSGMIQIVQKELEISKKDQDQIKSERSLFTEKNDILEKEVRECNRELSDLRNQLKSYKDAEVISINQMMQTPSRWKYAPVPSIESLFVEIDSITDRQDPPITTEMAVMSVDPVSVPMRVPVSMPVPSIQVQDVAHRLTLSPYAEWEHPELWLFKFRVDIQTELSADSGGGEKSLRPMPLQQCKDLIGAIYDIRHRLLQSVRVEDTLEHQVYRFFEKKYGLRKLVVKHAAVFLTSLRIYSSQSQSQSEYQSPSSQYQSDHTVAVFLAVFQNLLDESYWESEKAVQDTVFNYMSKLVHADRVSKDSADYRKCLDRRMKGDVSEQDCRRILDLLPYSKSHKNIFLEKLVPFKGNGRDNGSFTKTKGGNRGLVRQSQCLTPRLAALQDRSMTGLSRLSGNTDRDQTQSQTQYLVQAVSSGRVGNGNRDVDGDDDGVRFRQVSFQHFLTRLLHFHFKRSVLQLSAFRSCFAFHDTDADGVLPVQLFYQCLCNYMDEVRVRVRVQQRLNGTVSSPSSATSPPASCLGSLDSFYAFLRNIGFDSVNFVCFSNGVDIARHLVADDDL
eukprot:gene5616-11334_t